MAKTPKTLRELFLERCIKIDAVQRERAEVAKKGMAARIRWPKPGSEVERARQRAFRGSGRRTEVIDYVTPFFDFGLIPVGPSTFSSVWPVGATPTFFPDVERGFRMAPAMRRAWLPAGQEWLKLCAELGAGKLIIEGRDLRLFSGERVEIAPVRWLEGVWFDVRANAIYGTDLNVVFGDPRRKTGDELMVVDEVLDAGDVAPPMPEPVETLNDSLTDSVEDEKPPGLREQMVIYILLGPFPNGPSLDDIPGKREIVRDHWDQQRKAPLGDAGRRVEWTVPVLATVRRAIKKYLKHPERFPKPRQS